MDADGNVIGDGSLPWWLKFRFLSNQGSFLGNPPSSLDGTSLYLRVLASDGNTTGEDTFRLSIFSANDTPSVSGISITMNEDTTYTFTAAARAVELQAKLARMAPASRPAPALIEAEPPDKSDDKSPGPVTVNM